ncbi:MAG: AAA family ATPase [Phycisphaerae bacterium]|nr:AAA family ATPase [Phycisphaerae bacterium]
MHVNIVLIGYRGSGKSSAGRKLADQLWKDFVDTDQFVCRRFETDDIAAIWADHGEAAFRAAECEVVRKILAQDDQVVALGGGSVMQEQVRRDLAETDGTRCIYLKCSPQVLLQRIHADAGSERTRPALTEHGGGLEEITRVLAEREPVYEAVADKTLNVTYLDIPDTVHHLIKSCL